MKILFIDHTSLLSGAELALLNMLLHLDRREFQPTVILFSDGQLADAMRAADIPVQIVELDPAINKTTRQAAGKGTIYKLGKIVAIARFIWRLRQAIRKIKPDIVHTNSLKADLLGGIAARLAGTRLIWHIHDRIASDYLPQRMVRLFRHLARWLPHGIIANSRATLETLYLPVGKATVVAFPGIPDPTPGEPPSFAPPPAVSGSQALSPPRVILVGRISPWKGQDVFIRAAAMVHKDHPEVRFDIIGSVLFGEDAYEAEIRQLVQSLGMQEIISFLGFRNDVPELIAQSSLLVHASTIPEPFGQVVVQAMAAGKPVVATCGGGVLEIVQDGETGLLVPMGDATAMVAAIITILSNPTHAREMGRAGRQRFLAHFTIEKTVAAVQSLYQRRTP